MRKVIELEEITGEIYNPEIVKNYTVKQRASGEEVKGEPMV